MANLNYGPNYESPRPPPTQAAFQKNLNAVSPMRSASGAPPAPDPMASIYAQLFPGVQAQYGYNKTLVNQQNDQLNQQLGYLGANQASQTNYLNQDYANQLAQFGLSGQQLGLTGEGYAQQGAEARQRYDLQKAALAQQLQQANAGFSEGQQDLFSGATAAGSLQSKGTNEYNRRLGEQLGWQKQTIGRGNTANDEALYNALTTVGREQRGLGLSKQSLGLQQKSAQQKLTEALQQLGISTGSQQSSLYGQMQNNLLGLQDPSQLANFFSTIFGNS